MNKPNILFIIIDSLRQDKCLGANKKSLTPNLDSLIKNGVFFRQAISPSPITTPSLSSIFTGLYPYESTNLDNDIFTLKNNIPTFIETFEKSGYSTHAVIPEALNYTNIPEKFSNVEFFNSFATLYDGIGEKIVTKLNELSNEKPWLLYIHLEDLHGHALFHLSSDVNKIDEYVGKNQYEKMLSAIDPWIGKILNVVDEDNTIIIFTSDHGSTVADFTNEMSEFSLKNNKLKEADDTPVFKMSHKIITSLPKSFSPLRKKIADTYIDNKKKRIQNKLESELPHIEELNLTKYQKRLLKKSVVYPPSCHDENFRPALIFSGFGIMKNKIIDTQVSTIDIFPTLIDIIKINFTEKIRGTSFLQLFEEKFSKEKPVMIDSAPDSTHSKYSNAIGIRTSKYKYFRDRNNPNHDVYLYNLVNDPYELDNIYEEHPEIMTNFENELKQIDPTLNFTFKNTDKLTKDDTEKAKDILRELGYMK